MPGGKENNTIYMTVEYISPWTYVTVKFHPENDTVTFSATLPLFEVPFEISAYSRLEWQKIQSPYVTLSRKYHIVAFIITKL